MLLLPLLLRSLVALCITSCMYHTIQNHPEDENEWHRGQCHCQSRLLLLPPPL
jgi:predicted membrane channel-forming protein YqfA (hemolysin III family)